MSADELTPMRQQYLELKARYPDKILLFRMGDFFEAFDADAELIARRLEITLRLRARCRAARHSNGRCALPRSRYLHCALS